MLRIPEDGTRTVSVPRGERDGRVTTAEWDGKGGILQEQPSQWRGRKPLPKEVTMKGKTWDTGRSKPHEGTASRPRKQCRRAQSKRMELPKEHRAKGGQGGRCAGHREPHEAGEGPWTSSRRLRGAFEEFPGDLDQSNVVK